MQQRSHPIQPAIPLVAKQLPTQLQNNPAMHLHMTVSRNVGAMCARMLCKYADYETR
jgi:hypothetical protein